MGKTLQHWNGRGNEIEFEAMLSYWFSWYVLPNSPENVLNPYVFSVAVQPAKEERLAVASIYLGSLFNKLDGCIRNIVKSVGHYHVVTQANIAFLQVFLPEQFEMLSPKPT